jgi:hypothetical protein
VIKNDLLFKLNNEDILLVVPKAMRTQIIKQTHDQGHFSVAKTEALLFRDYFKHLDLAQLYINCASHRSIGTTPFRLLFGAHVRVRENPQIVELLQKEWINDFQNDRNEIREQARENIIKIQSENRKSSAKRRKAARKYSEDDLVAIKRTQLGPGLKLANKYLGPYSVVKVLRNDRYIVQKIGEHEGPSRTSTSADHMKPWTDPSNDDSEDESEDEDIRGRMSVQNGRV